MIPYVQHTITPEDEAAVLRALRSDRLTQGPEVDALETEVAALAGAQFCVAVSSGTAALACAYQAAGPSELTVPAVTFMATANAAVAAHRTVRFADCDAVTGLTRAAGAPGAVFVTLGGQPAPPDWPGIVDACHGPLRHPSHALATVLSFHAAKHVAAGEGGAVLTNDPDVAGRCYELRDHGRDLLTRRMLTCGFNYRMSELTAALARSQLTRYHAGVARRRAIAAQYDAAWGAGPVGFTPVPHHPDSARHLYQILVHRGRRTEVQAQLAKRGIGTQVHYPPVPREPWWAAQFIDERWPGAEQHAAETLSLPLYPSMTAVEVGAVIGAVLEVFRELV